METDIHKMSASFDMSNGTISLLRELRDRDSETGLLTARRLYQALLSEVARSDRYGNHLSCVLLKVEGLDENQHDARLQLANRVAVVMRNTDHAGLWQEDEFLLILPETDEAGARGFAAKLQKELTELASSFNESGAPAPSVTMRATAWRSGDDAEAMLERLETKTRA